MPLLRRIVFPLIAVFLAVFASTTFAQLPTPNPGFAIPVTGTESGKNSKKVVFEGTFTLKRFAETADGRLAAVGVLTGKMADGRSVMQTVEWAVNPGAPAAAGGIVAQQLACEVLHLDLGPLDLNILGLQINLSRIVLDITAIPGALLGDLLCALSGLLSGGGPLAQIVGLLNQILGVLQNL